MVSGVWVTSRHFRPSEWARMQEVGYAGGGGIGVVGEHGRGWGGRRGGGEGGGIPPPPRQNPPPSKAATPPQPFSKKRSKKRVRLRVRLGERRRGNPP